MCHPKKKPNASRQALRDLDETLLADRRGPDEVGTHGKRMARLRRWVLMRLGGSSTSHISMLDGVNQSSVNAALAPFSWGNGTDGYFMIRQSDAEGKLRLRQEEILAAGADLLPVGIYRGQGGRRAVPVVMKSGAMAHLR